MSLHALVAVGLYEYDYALQDRIEPKVVTIFH